MSKNDGLWVFVAVTMANVLGLMVDYMLMRLSVPTVTEIAKRNPWVAALILVANSAGGIGLAYHLLLKNGDDGK